MATFYPAKVTDGDHFPAARRERSKASPPRFGSELAGRIGRALACSHPFRSRPVRILQHQLRGRPDVKLTLVVATLGDQGTLRACLESLCNQQGAPDFEAIVVDQNDDDRVAALIPGFAARLRIRHERVRFRGASRARNHGSGLAQGAWLGFPDDDCELLPDTLAQFERVRAGQDGLRVITGRTVDETGAPNVLRWGTEPSAFTPSTMFRSVTEATLFVEAHTFAAAGGFDERFGPGARYPAAEGIELVLRLFAAEGHACAFFDPAIRMQHPTKIPPFSAWAAKRFHSYAIGDGALVAKSPGTHVLRWGARTVASAGLQMFSWPPWRGVSFAARLAGLIRGYSRYHLDALRGR